MRPTGAHRSTRTAQFSHKVFFIHIILCCLFALVETCVGSTTSQLHSDQTLVELPKTQSAASKKILLLFGFSRVFQESGKKQWTDSVVCETYKAIWQTESHRMKGPVIPFGTETFLIQISTKDTSHLHQFGISRTGSTLRTTSRLRFMSKEVGVKKVQDAFIFACAD